MFAILPVFLVAQTSLSAQIDQYVTPFAKRQDFAGVVLVRKEGKTLYRKAFGLADAEWKTANRPETVFRIASLSKTFTSGAIYLLEKRGKLAFTDKLSKYLPNFPKGDKIVLQHLLAHVSGVGVPEMSALMHQEPTLDEIVARIAATPFQFEPGASNSYSNSGYTLLAKVVELVSGKSFDQFLRDEFFGPLGMRSTGHFLQAELVPYRARPYFPGPPPAGILPIPGFDELPYVGAGALWSTADDLGKWLEAVRTKRFYDIDKLSWPMGWGKRTYFEKRANEQTGISTGFVSGMIYFPEEKVEVVVLGNIQTQFAGRAIIDLAGLVFGKKPAPHVAPALTTLDKVEKSVVVGKYSPGGKDVMEIIERRGGLFYHWNDDTEYRYLAPVGARSLYARDEFATWTWSDADTIKWSAPGANFDLKRVKP